VAQGDSKHQALNSIPSTAKEAKKLKGAMFMIPKAVSHVVSLRKSIRKILLTPPNSLFLDAMSSSLSW
jgi:hypothetical protein